MSGRDTVVRLAARGDGLTQSGKHVSGTAPGDVLLPDGTVEHGPNRAEPPCRHFGICGGCELQHIQDAALAQFVFERVAFAAKAQGLVPDTIAAAEMSPRQSRRRATLKAVNAGGGRCAIGFARRGSHKLVDLQQCCVLMPRLFALIPPLRRYFSTLQGRFAFTVALAMTDQGVSIALGNFMPEGLQQVEELRDFCAHHDLARLTFDGGYGAEAFWEPHRVTVRMGSVAVDYPPGAFLQATAHGEAALVAAAREWLTGASRVADLFSGLGTFTFPLAANINMLAVEADKAAINALADAARKAQLPIETRHRDLFRNPLRAAELKGLDAVLIDPPRAGAKAQVEQIAMSDVPRVVYISCNPSSWSRDAAQLAAAGYALRAVRPVGQFRWSTHVELASLFVKHGEDSV